MKEQLAYKFRIYPDEPQTRLFRMTVGCCRFVYNLFLEQKKFERGRSNPRRLSQVDQIKQLPEAKRDFPFLIDVPNHCLQQTIIDLHKAWANFFAKRAAFPKPRRKFQNEAFRFPDPKQIKTRPGEIFLPKAGWVKMIDHRPIIGIIKNVTVSTSGDHWYVSIQVEREIDEPVMREGPELGADLGIVHALALSDGTVYDVPRMTDKEKLKEKNLHRIISRRAKGSRNRARAQRDLRRFKAKLVRRRKDAKHKMTTDVVRCCAVLHLEDLKVKKLTASARGTIEEPGSNVAQKAGLNRSFADVSPGETRVQLVYKMRRSGGRTSFHNPAYSSQRCAECGYINAANRPDRGTFECVSCGHAACPDTNAGRNLLYLGVKAQTGGLPGLACESNRVAGRKQEEDGSSQSATQIAA
jgi:putative transposase